MNRCHATLITAIAAAIASACTNSHSVIDDVESASLIGRAFTCTEEINAWIWVEVWAETDRGCVFLDLSSTQQHETVDVQHRGTGYEGRYFEAARLFEGTDTCEGVERLDGARIDAAGSVTLGWGRDEAGVLQHTELDLILSAEDERFRLVIPEVPFSLPCPPR